MLRAVWSVGLLVTGLAAQAGVTSYTWSIDWRNQPDQTGLFTFDDGGDGSARVLFWDFVSGGPPPAGAAGLPPGFAAAGSLAYDGSFVTGFSGCNDAINSCALPSMRFGFTRAAFSLSGSGSAVNYTFNYSGSDPASPCSQTNLLALMPDSCFAIDSGRTTFALATPVPEPGTLALLIAGLAGIGMFAQGRRR